MPVEWVGHGHEAPELSGASYYAQREPPLAQLHLWPHRSLPKRGFAIFMALSFALICLPLLAVLGTALLWGLAPFAFGTLALTFAMIQRSYRDGEVLEELSLWTDRAELTRRARREPTRHWAANPHWVSVGLHRTGGPVKNYVTLRGGGREVEIGAFLSAEERLALHSQLQAALARLG